MKYLCIDYGSKKVGFAQSDDDGQIAFPLMISPNDNTLLKDTLELVKQLKISTVVFGESMDSKGKLNPIAKETRSFATKLEGKVDIKIAFEKEWYSTTEARKQPGKEGSHDVDDQAAAIILQRYLDRVNGPKSGDDEYDAAEKEDEEEVEVSDNW